MKNTLIFLLFSWACSHVFAKTPEDAIAALVAVGPKGEGNEAASKAWPEVAALDAKELPALLSAMNEANGLGQNWLRGAVDVIVAERYFLSRGLLLLALLLRRTYGRELHRQRLKGAALASLESSWLC